MVRISVEIKPIEDKAKRHTAFTKRRQGLFRKATDLCHKYDAEAVIVAISKAGNCYIFGHPRVDPVLARYYSIPPSCLGEECANDRVEERAHGVEIREENNTGLSNMTDVEKRITGAVGNGRPAWDVALGNLELSKLEELEEAIENIKSQVATHAIEIEASGQIIPIEIEVSGERIPEGEFSGAERGLIGPTCGD